MPLGDVGAFHRWANDDDPSDRIRRAVRWWIADLAVTPWQAPSVPFPELSDQPTFEVRYADVPGTSVGVFYKVWYGDADGELVDLIWVG